MLQKLLAFLAGETQLCGTNHRFSIKLKKPTAGIPIRTKGCSMCDDEGSHSSPASIICEIATDASSDRFSMHYTQARSRGIAARYGMRLC
jgi:hypothetical protein